MTNTRNSKIYLNGVVVNINLDATNLLEIEPPSNNKGTIVCLEVIIEKASSINKDMHERQRITNVKRVSVVDGNLTAYSSFKGKDNVLTTHVDINDINLKKLSINTVTGLSSDNLVVVTHIPM